MELDVVHLNLEAFTKNWQAGAAWQNGINFTFSQPSLGAGAIYFLGYDPANETSWVYALLALGGHDPLLSGCFDSRPPWPDSDSGGGATSDSSGDTSDSSDDSGSSSDSDSEEDEEEEGQGEEWEGQGEEWEGQGEEWEGQGEEWDGQQEEWEGQGEEWEGQGEEEEDSSEVESSSDDDDGLWVAPGRGGRPAEDPDGDEAFSVAFSVRLVGVRRRRVVRGAGADARAARDQSRRGRGRGGRRAGAAGAKAGAQEEEEEEEEGIELGCGSCVLPPTVWLGMNAYGVPIAPVRDLAFAARGKYVLRATITATTATRLGSGDSITVQGPPSAAALRPLLQAEEFSDLRLVAGGDGGASFSAHRAVLAAASPVFTTMLTAGMVEANTQTIRLPETPAAVLELLLDHLYGHSITVSPTAALQLLQLADQYQLNSPLLADRLATWLATARFDAGTVAELLPAAVAYAAPRRVVVNWGAQAAGALRAVVASPGFPDWPVAALTEVLLRACPLQALSAALAWVEAPAAADAAGRAAVAGTVPRQAGNGAPRPWRQAPSRRAAWPQLLGSIHWGYVATRTEIETMRRLGGFGSGGSSGAGAGPSSGTEAGAAPAQLPLRIPGLEFHLLDALDALSCRRSDAALLGAAGAMALFSSEQQWRPSAVPRRGDEEAFIGQMVRSRAEAEGKLEGGQYVDYGAPGCTDCAVESGSEELVSDTTEDLDCMDTD